MSYGITNRCFEVSSIFTVVLLSLYITKRDFTIPLSVSSAFDNWGGVMRLFENAASPVRYEDLLSQLWCPSGAHSSPQCHCMLDYHSRVYWPDVVSQNLTQYLTREPLLPDAAALFVRLGQNHSEGILRSCLRFRPSWRQESCGDFCRIHLATPVLLASLYMTVIFSCVAHYRSRTLYWLKSVVPLTLAALTLISQLILDRTGGIISSLSIVSVVVECYYLGPSPPWRMQVFWSYHRFFIASLAVWVAVTHQARDVYLVASYAMLGFFAGFMAYAVFLIKQGAPGRHSGANCLLLFIGIGVVCACFVMLIQQHWYGSSPMWSSLAAPVVFVFALAQCLLQTPFSVVSISVNLLINLILLSVSVASVAADLTKG